MKCKYWVSFLFAMMIAFAFFFSPSVMAQTNEAGATIVREVTLSPGNWLWDHYRRMSPEYRRAHPFKQFFESEACYLKDRKCTEEDWRRVPVSQAVYIPAEQLFVRVPPGAEFPGVTLAPSENGAEVYPIVLDAHALSADEVLQLTAEVSHLEKINSALRAASDFEETFSRGVIALLIVIIIAFALVLLLLLDRLRKTEQKLRNAESCFRGYPEHDSCQPGSTPKTCC